ncbi:pseudouridine synthase [Nocardia sp. NPDC050406]|uniref:pseudouridine synthase n=1 Tax=Nocardia sp. NPDC050406 TaxID=3364318 RepID=UPI003795287E
MNTPARRDGTPDRRKRGFEPPRGGSARGRAGQGSNPSRGATPTRGAAARGDRSWDSRDARGTAGRGNPSRGQDSRGFDARGGDRSRGFDTRGAARGADARGSRGFDARGTDPRGGDRSRGFDQRGGSRGADPRGGSRGFDARGDRSRGFDNRGGSRGADTRGGFDRGGDRSRQGDHHIGGARGRIGGGRPFAPTTSPAAKTNAPTGKSKKPKPQRVITSGPVLNNAKPARRQYVESESQGPKKLPWGEGERLQKVLAKAGVASRRAAEDLIAAGRVEVDGSVVTEQGLRIDPENAVVRVDGMRVVVRNEQVYLALNKPKGWQSTMSDEMNRPCVGDIVAERVMAGQRLFHVGRLDADTEGLLLLTNDGDLAHRLMHPSFEVSKTYLATVNGEVHNRDIGKQLRNGVELDDGPAKVDRFQVLEVGEGKSLVKIVLHEGRKHIVRRLLAAVGHPVTALVRTHIGPVALGDQRPGTLRVLGRDEIGKLYEAVSL